MPETNSPSKENIVQEFKTMMSFELSARDLYTQIAERPDIEPAKIKTVFGSLAADEQRHANLVQEIINIATNAL